MELLDIQQNEALHIVLKKHYQELIKSGQLKPGEKLPGERAIADKYSVSRWTVVEALKLLEQEHYIKRIDRRGAFVNDPDAAKSTAVNIIYALPEGEISEANLGFSRWQRHHEIQTGLMAGMRKFGLNLQLVDPAGFTLDTAVEMFARSDGVIFWDTVQEELLRRLTQRGVNCVVMAPSSRMPGFSSVGYGREEGIKMVSDFIIENKYKSVGFLVGSSLAERAARIKMNLEISGVKTSPEWIYPMGACSINEGYDILSSVLSNNLESLPELLYCDQMIFPIPLLRVIYERGWKLGRDIKVMSYTCRQAITNISPDLTYVRIPYFEMGFKACELIKKMFMSHDNTITHIKIPPELVRSISA
jgi:DNA-binding LacI/PurR family transcriptional regulator